MDGNQYDGEGGPVREIVETMLDDGFKPAILVFLAPDDTTRLWHREDLDAEDLMRFLLATGAATGASTLRASRRSAATPLLRRGALHTWGRA